VQVQEKAGLTFAAALRSILRQDPNVVLIGEIRDKETAQIAVQASLTATSCCPRCIRTTRPTPSHGSWISGWKAYKIAASLRGVVAQRLMRKLCTTCKEVWMEAPPSGCGAGFRPGHRSTARGLPRLRHDGLPGRFSILEILTMSPELERRIAAGEAADRIADAAGRGGMKTLWDSGLAHVMRGESSSTSLHAVVDIPDEAEAPPPADSRGFAQHRKSRRSTGAAAPVSTVFDLLEESAPPRGALARTASRVEGAARRRRG